MWFVLCVWWCVVCLVVRCVSGGVVCVFGCCAWLVCVVVVFFFCDLFFQWQFLNVLKVFKSSKTFKNFFKKLSKLRRPPLNR